MAKLIMISREELEKSQLDLERWLADEPGWMEVMEEMHLQLMREIRRRDYEFAAKHANDGVSIREAK